MSLCASSKCVAEEAPGDGTTAKPSQCTFLVSLILHAAHDTLIQAEHQALLTSAAAETVIDSTSTKHHCPCSGLCILFHLLMYAESVCYQVLSDALFINGYCSLQP